MGKIRIYEDFSGLADSDDVDIEVHSIADYVPMYGSLLEALEEGKNFAISIAREARAVSAWLENTSEKWGSEKFEFIEVTYKQRLSATWGIVIPDEVTEREIQSADLLDYDVDPSPGDSFDDIILRHDFSPYMAYGQLPLRKFDVLLNDLMSLEELGKDFSRFQKSIFRKKLGLWNDEARGKNEQEIIGKLRDDVRGLYDAIAQYKILRNYPEEVGRRVLGDQYKMFASLPLELGAMQVDGYVYQETKDQIRVYLNEQRRGGISGELISELLTQASGHLVLEFQVIRELLSHDDVEVTQDLIDRIHYVFRPIRDRIEEELLDINLLVSPEMPIKPNRNGNWEFAQWVDWAVNDYFPYRFWMEEVDQYDEDIVGYGREYANWLYDHYGELTTSFPRILYRAFSNIGQAELISDKSPILVVVIDNYNYKYYQHLNNLFEGVGFFRSYTEPYLAMLPTCTEVSKKSLLTGDISPFEGTAYESPVAERLGTVFDTEKVKYLPYLGSLNDIRQDEHDLYVLNFNKIDEILHESETQLGISYSKGIRRRLSDLVEAIRSFANRIGVANELQVIITSDHGSTKITPDYPNLIDQEFYKNRLEDSHHRYIGVTEKEWESLPDNVDFECYKFSKEVFDLNKNYLVARGYGRFVDHNETTYSHGGLTPEESIVPLSIYQPVIEEPEPIQINLLENEFRYGTKTEIPLELINTNPYPCNNIQISILNENIEVPENILINIIKAESTRRILISARFQKSLTKIKKIIIRCNAEVLQRQKQKDFEFDIEVRSIMETRFDLEDLDGEI